jgi:hypothetical protein
MPSVVSATTGDDDQVHRPGPVGAVHHDQASKASRSPPVVAEVPQASLPSTMQARSSRSMRGRSMLIGQASLQAPHRLSPMHSDNLPLLCDHHRKVFEAIKDKDAKRSRAEMETHLAWVERQWMRIINAIT